MMRRASWTKMIVLGGGLLGLTAGCATGHARRGERAFARELRGSVVVSGAHARSALAGPLHLLHIDYENRQAVELYSVARHDGTDADADCAAGPALMRLQLHGRRPNPIDADVGAGEVVCLVGPAAPTAREVRVSWHASVADHPAPMALAAAFPPAR